MGPSRQKLKGLMAVTYRIGKPLDEFIEQIEGAAAGGADIIELREKNISETELITIAGRVKTITDKYNIPLILNDYPEIAAKINADGVHLGQSDPAISAARRILPAGSIVGGSAYNSIERAMRAEAEGADYAAMSSPYTSLSKPLKKLTTPEIIRETKKRLKIPLFVIGGITEENAEEIMSLGIDGIAVMNGIFSKDNTEKATREIKSAIERFL